MIALSRCMLHRVALLTIGSRYLPSAGPDNQSVGRLRDSAVSQSLTTTMAFRARHVPGVGSESGSAEPLPLPLPSVSSSDGAIGGASAALLPLSNSSAF